MSLQQLDHDGLNRILHRAQKRQRRFDRMISARVYTGVFVALLSAVTALILALR
jgi:hypothetical protein